ncbi:MAG: hypothetical protein HY782_09550 [Chloroflexi bacterium]|nr:hypothetical protein [Chloroflexota bacterium]
MPGLPFEIGPSSFTAIVGFFISLWLGCYLVTHTTHSRVAWLAILTILSLAGYFLHAVLCLHVPAVQAGFLWRRFLGWFAIPALPLWLHVTASLLPAEFARRERWFVIGMYAAAIILIGLWLFGAWTFSTASLVPLELAPPLALLAVVAALAATANLVVAQYTVRDPILKRRQRLLLIATVLGSTGAIYWSLFAAWWSPPWDPPTTLALGHSLLIAGLLTLAYGIVRQNVFLTGQWIARDALYFLFAIAAVALLYVVAIAGAWFLARALNFDALMLILVVVTGLVIVTHLLTDWVRAAWDAIFFRELRPLRAEMRFLAQEMSRHVQPEQEMQFVVESVAHLTGSPRVSLALDEGGSWAIRASTHKERIGEKADLEQTDAYFFREPLRVFDKTVGYLLLGEKSEGAGYSRQDRAWISALSARLAPMLEQARLREAATHKLAALAQEVTQIQSQEQAMHQEMQHVLAGSRPPIDRFELCEAIRYHNHPERLAELLRREGSTLAALPTVARAGPRAVPALQQCLTTAVEALRPPNNLPSLEALRARPVRIKSRRHLPSTVADYYTARLVMAGYTFEGIAEELGVSSRQAQNYFERVITRLLGFLEMRKGEIS